MLIKLIENWLDENGIQNMHGAIPGTLMVSARCWGCGLILGRWAGIEEDGPNITIDHDYGRPVEKISAADPQLFLKLVVALKRCEHMPKVRIEGLSI